MPSRPSEIYARIYAVVRRIPRGRVATYGQIAALAGLPHAPRVAGYALFALPAGSPLPWHRVVAAGGRLSIARLDSSAAMTQRIRLEKEGVRFDARGRADLERHGWKRPARASRVTRRAVGPAASAGLGVAPRSQAFSVARRPLTPTRRPSGSRVASKRAPATRRRRRATPPGPGS